MILIEIFGFCAPSICIPESHSSRWRTDIIPLSNDMTSLNFSRTNRDTLMFDGPEHPKSLDEEVFNSWLEKGRESKIGYNYLLIIWDEYESDYRPVYAERRDELGQYQTHDNSSSMERLVAMYDLYSESRIV